MKPHHRQRRLHALTATIIASHAQLADDLGDALCHMRETVDGVLEIGRTLLEASRLLTRQEFAMWVESSCKPVTPQQAAAYMRVTERHGRDVERGTLDFDGCKRLYLAAGLMPPKRKAQPKRRVERGPEWLSLVSRLEGDIAKAPAAERERMRAVVRGMAERMG